MFPKSPIDHLLTSLHSLTHTPVCSGCHTRPPSDPAVTHSKTPKTPTKPIQSLRFDPASEWRLLCVASRLVCRRSLFLAIPTFDQPLLHSIITLHPTRFIAFSSIRLQRTRARASITTSCTFTRTIRHREC
jgi:hypothetical protein